MTTTPDRSPSHIDADGKQDFDLEELVHVEETCVTFQKHA